MDKGLVLVTGGAGFIGSNLVHALVKRGYRVRVLDNLSRSTLTNIQELVDENVVEFIDGDIRYADVVSQAMKGVDFVFHEAATNINRSEKYPEESFAVNFNACHTVFKAASDEGVKKVIFASSASVYGEPKKLPMSEEDPLNPITPYCVSKLGGEHLLKFFARRKGLKYVALRYFNVYGRWQKTDAYYTSVIINFIRRLLKGESPLIDGEGNQSMDFINVKDVVNANILALESHVENEIFNVGGGSQTTIKQLAELLIDIVGVDVHPQFRKREVLVTRRQADISKIKQMLGFEPSISLRDGLKEIVEDIRMHPHKY